MGNQIFKKDCNDLYSELPLQITAKYEYNLLLVVLLILTYILHHLL